MAIICSCQHVSHRVIDAAIDRGARTVEEIGAVCGAGTDCGCCEPAILVALAERTSDERHRWPTMVGQMAAAGA